MRVLKAMLIAGCVFVRLSSAQEFLDEVNFKAQELGGIHLVGISVYSGYSSNALPQVGYSVGSTAQGGGLGGDESYGATASLAWQLRREKTNASILYTGTYGGMVHYSGVDGYSQMLSVSASRLLSPKWTLSFSGNAQDSTIAQYLFEPGPLGVITQLPTTFDDLAAAFSAGQFSNAQAASLLTGAPLTQAAGRSLLLGNRVLSYTGQAELDYAASSRLHFHFASFAAAGQNRLGSGQETGGSPVVVMPRSIGANAGGGFSYSLSPRTEIGIDVTADHTVSHYQSVYLGNAVASFGRKMGEHWFLRLMGGGSYGIVTQEELGTPETRQIVGGGSFGFQTSANTLVASYNRTGSDEYGLAVGTVTMMSGAWNWRRPGSRWGAFASYGNQQTRNAGYVSVSGWQVSSGITSQLNPHTTVSLQYAYLRSVGTYAGTFNNIGIHSIRLSLGWAPQSH
jgi:hypothetical protein